MRFALFSLAIAALSVQQAASLPLHERANDITASEKQTLILAANLELLENAFYTQGLAQFSEADFTAANFSALVRQRYQEIQGHEQIHVELLSTVLGPDAPKPCQYKFPIPDLASFIALSQIFESVGSSTYTGAMNTLTTPELLTVAAAILATEARQQTWISNAVLVEGPWGGAFETPIDAEEALTLASPFIVSCPSTNPPLNLKTFPSFNITGAPIPGQNVTVHLPSTSVKATFIVFQSALDTLFVAIDKNSNVVVPSNVSGTVFALATSSGSDLSLDTIVAGPAVLLVERGANGAALQ